MESIVSGSPRADFAHLPKSGFLKSSKFFKKYFEKTKKAMKIGTLDRKEIGAKFCETTKEIDISITG